MVGGTAAGVIYAVILSTSQITQWEPGSGGGVCVHVPVIQKNSPTLQSSPKPEYWAIDYFSTYRMVNESTA